MVQFTKLRLHGFKSFVDPTVMEIGSGLTGVVGPNGCGKSNLVEALRWVMGETSAKRMRGSGMDDVIFSGTKNRPARNTAEVSLWLDNSDRKAPAELNNSDELEIIRHIERENGSTYRVNGKIVRAKDIQLLFADSSIGAHSPALVSQGRVADLISAKPTQRRLVLEEAAGISGLHTRKHEAELKLKAAENNLTRAEDVLGTMELQMQALKKQARQASRYRNLSDHIKKAEATVLYLQWLKTNTALEQAMDAFKNADKAVAQHTIEVTTLTKEHTEKTAILPELRKKEAEVAASLQHLKLSYNMLEKEATQLDETLAENKLALEQIDSDITHETDNLNELKERQKLLTTELATYSNDSVDNIDNDLEILKNELNEQQEKIQILRETQASIEAKINDSKYKKQRWEQSLDNIDAQKAKVTVRTAHMKHELNELKSNIPNGDEEEKLSRAIKNKVNNINKLKDNIDVSDKEKLSLEVIVENAVSSLQSKENEFIKLKTEIETLEQMLTSKDIDDSAEPILNNVEVKNGFEKALAVALGEDADASENKDAPIYWLELPELKNTPKLPTSIEALSNFVKTPKALNRRLSLIGVVEDDNIASKLITELEAGQVIVTKTGSAWRWDGLVITSDAPSASAIRLEQKNKLNECKKLLPDLEKQLEESKNILEKEKDKRDKIINEIAELRRSLNSEESEIHNLRLRYEEVVNANSEVKARISAVQENIKNAENELSELQNEYDDIKNKLASLDETTNLEKELAQIVADIENLRQSKNKKQSEYDQLLGAEQVKKQRIEELQTDLQNCCDRLEKTTTRLSELKERRNSLLEKQKLLLAKPENMEEELQQLLNKITEAEKIRDIAADKLAEVENAVSEVQTKLRLAEKEQADAREARAHAKATVSAAKETEEMIQAQIHEKFSCDINEMLVQTAIETEADKLPPLEKAQDKLERLLRERDNMGPVNLRADIESQELAEQMDLMIKEKDDLISAISKLRQGISKINKEARERLLKAFDVVNNHFQDLFTRLFNGGSAYLELTDADDPLEAGLEIYAQPPGKKMQILSLFSGGEQTLTSIALIFAMFLTNPAPICVLDEIDAPLDDSNVDRVCTLLEQLTKETSTRFIVITHHRMTMARMDRLYGVTMGEKGVSQLVSVDLQQPSLLDNLAA